jgi:hypothetical protein
MVGAVITDANLAKARFDEAVLDGADISASSVREGTFHRASLKGTNFSRSDLRDADLRCAIATDSVLVATDLTGADLRGTDLRRANVTNAILTNARYSTAPTTLNGRECPATRLPDGLFPGELGMLKESALSCGELPGVPVGVARLIVGAIPQDPTANAKRTADNHAQTLRNLLPTSWANRVLVYKALLNGSVVHEIVVNGVTPAVERTVCSWLLCQGWTPRPCQLALPGDEIDDGRPGAGSATKSAAPKP